MQDSTIGGGGGDIHMLMSILADGEEQARQLGEAATVDESYYRGVARQLQCTFAKAMAVARAIESAATTTTGDRSDSPRSADESSARTARDVVVAQQERQDMSKRRKGLPRWTEKFRVPDASLEATPDDGFSWRKYGQKDILGAKFPRGYYRCTYRNAQGCPATKQVQRSDADLAVFDVTYQGAHTCHQKQRHAAAASPPAGHQPPPPPPPPPEADPSAELLVNFKHGLKVETKGLAPPPAANFQDQQFCFPSVPPFHAGVGDVDAGGFSSPAFVSPAGSSAAGSSYFSVDHCYGGEPRGQFVMSRWDSSELHEVVSAATSSAAAAAVVDPAAVTVATAGGGFVDYPLYLQHGGELVDDPHLPFPPLFGPASMYGQYRDA